MLQIERFRSAYCRRRAVASRAVLRLVGLVAILLISSTGLAFGQTVISQANWTLHFVDSQETVGGNYAATNAFDGNPSTMWTTQWQGGAPVPPHDLAINLGSSYSVSGIRYLPRQDGSVVGRIAQYQIYISADGTNWGSPVASGTFPNSAAEQQVLFTATTGRYIRFRELSEISGYPYAAVAEFNVLATGNQAPNGVITAPAADVAIAPGQTVTFSSTGTDPDNNTPLSYAWNFGAGGPAASASQNPGAVTFPNAGVYTVTLTVTDSLGKADPTPATRTITVGSGSGGLIPKTNWTIWGVDSQETVAGNYAAANAIDGNPNSIWTSQWQGAAPPPPHDIAVNLGASYTVTGFRYLPRQDASAIGRIANYEFYTNTDGASWILAASGTFANNATEQQVVFSARTARYFLLREKTEVSGLPYVAVAELSLLGTTGSGNQAPDGTITAPAANVTITAGQSVSFSGSGTDPDNNLPLTYSWNFGSGGPGTSTSQNPGAVTFPTAGVYTVTFTVTDALGAPDPVPATRTVTVQSAGGTGSPVTLVPQGGWSVTFVDSEETESENGAARNAFDGNGNTAWITKYTNGGPVPPHEIQINLGATYPVTGFRYLPFQSTQAGRVGDYEFYVSTDGSNWGSPVAVGAFPDTNSSGIRDVYFPAKTGRYIRFRALTEVNNGDYTYTALSELNVLAVGAGVNQPPTVAITSPAADITIVAGSAILLSGTASDPEANLPVSYQWRVGPTAGVADFGVQQPGLVQFDRAGTFTLTFAALDSLGRTNTATRTVTVTAGTPLSTAGWSLRYVDSQDTANGNVATRAFDGNPSTLWVTEWAASQPLPPHEIQIDLGATRDVRGFRYLPRQDGSTVGNIALYRFYVSTDGTNWGTPVAFGLFDKGSAEKEVATIPKAGRYIRLQALNEINGYPYTVVADLKVLTPSCQGTGVTLAQPRTRQIQPSGTVAVNADACLSAGQGVRFVVDGGPGSGGAQTDVFAAPYATVLSGLSLAEHVVDAYVITNAGALVPGNATHDVATQVGIGAYFVAMGDGMTLGYGDDQPTDDNSADGRNLHGGYTPLLADGLTTAKGYPVTVENEGVGSTASINGANSILALVQKHPNAQYFIVMYGHNDAEDGVPSGLGLSPGQTGYAGSFKERIQQIINTAKAAGKGTILAKAPPILPVNTGWDLSIQQYNKVMDELAATAGNNIPVPAVDLYSYFLAHTGTEYQGTILMNGIGYQSMARIFLQSLR